MLKERWGENKHKDYKYSCGICWALLSTPHTDRNILYLLLTDQSTTNANTFFYLPLLKCPHLKHEKRLKNNSDGKSYRLLRQTDEWHAGSPSGDSGGPKASALWADGTSWHAHSDELSDPAVLVSRCSSSPVWNTHAGSKPGPWLSDHHFSLRTDIRFLLERRGDTSGLATGRRTSPSPGPARGPALRLLPVSRETGSGSSALTRLKKGM